MHVLIKTQNLWFWPKRPPLAFSVAEMSVAEMSGPKRPRPKCPRPKCPTFESHSKNNSTVIFLNFWISPVFCIHPKILQQRNTIKNADKNANSFNPDQTVSV